jgi:hypothetical protein
MDLFTGHDVDGDGENDVWIRHKVEIPDPKYLLLGIVLILISSATTFLCGVVTYGFVQPYFEDDAKNGILVPVLWFLLMAAIFFIYILWNYSCIRSLEITVCSQDSNVASGDGCSDAVKAGFAGTRRPKLPLLPAWISGKRRL